MSESTLQKLMRISGRFPVECQCPECQKFCDTPCLGTPQDIMRLIEAGYREKLFVTLWGVGMLMGAVNYPIPMVQAERTENGCAFFCDGLCELHDLGLKPVEGVLAHHTIQAENSDFSRWLSWNVAKEWIDVDNLDIVLAVFKEFGIDPGK